MLALALVAVGVACGYAGVWIIRRQRRTLGLNRQEMRSLEGASAPRVKTFFAVLVVLWGIGFATLGLQAALPGMSLGSGDRLARRGFNQMAAGDFQRAAESFEAARDGQLKVEEPEFVLGSLAIAYMELGRIDESIEVLLEALEAAPESEQNWTNLGIAYRVTGDFAKAEESYLHALDLDPDYAEAHTSIGALYFLQARYEDAVTHLERAIALNEGLAVAWANVSLSYAAVGRFDDADVALRRAATIGYPNASLLRETIDSLRSLESSTRL